MEDTKVVITAETGQAEASLISLGRHVDGVSGKFLDFTGVAGMLGGALSITAFGTFIKNNIDAADNLGKLAQKTGTAVEELSGLKFAADQNSTSLEAVANAGKKLSASLVDKPELFAQFGITAKDSTGALVQMADIFAGMPDGVEKTALAVKLMGKSGEEMIPMLNNGSEALQQLIDQGRELNPVTAENAAAAAQFNDNLDLLIARGMTPLIKIANDLLPKLNDTVDAFVELSKSGESFLPIGSVIKTIFETIVVLGANIGYVFKQAGNEIGGMAAQLAALATGDFKGAKAIGEMMRADAAKAREDIDAFSERIINGSPKASEPAPAPAPSPATRSSPAAGRALLAGLGGDKEDSKAEREKARIDAQIEREQAKFDKLSEMATLYSASEQDRVTWKLAFDLDAMQKDREKAIENKAWNEELETSYQQARIDREAMAAEEIKKINDKAREDKEKQDQAKMRGEISIANFSKLLRRGDYTDAMNMAQQLTAGLATKNRAAFELNKAASLAKATVQGYQMIQAAAADGASWGGYAGAIAEGALAAAYVAANLEAINSAQFGGGSSIPSGGGSVPSQATSPGVPVSEQNPAAQQQPVQVNIYNTGTFVDAQAFIDQSVIPQIKDAVQNRDVLLIDPRSRQAQVLGA